MVLGHRVHHFPEGKGGFAIPLEHSVIVGDDQLPAKLQLLFLVGDLPALRGILLEKVADAAPNAVDDDRLFLLLDQMPDYWGKVAIAGKQEKRLGRVLGCRSPVDVIQHDKVGHILHVASRQAELGLDDMFVTARTRVISLCKTAWAKFAKNSIRSTLYCSRTSLAHAWTSGFVA